MRYDQSAGIDSPHLCHVRTGLRIRVDGRGHNAAKARKSSSPCEPVWSAAILPFLAAAVVLLVILFVPVGAPAASEPFEYPPEEDFTYDIRFLWLKQVALGRLRIRRLSGNRYQAELLAETKGIVGFLTAHQQNHYTSEMEFDPETGHLVPHRFTKVVSSAGKVVKSVTEVDRMRGRLRWVATENGKVRDKGSQPIPGGVAYEDLLSAFFNLRHGALGPLTPGRRLIITSLPYYQTAQSGETKYDEAYVNTFEIYIADARTERMYRKRFDRENEEGLLVIVQMPKSIFDQKTGKALVWFSRDLTPIAARVEDVIFFGDVFGVLRRGLGQKPAGAQYPFLKRGGNRLSSQPSFRRKRNFGRSLPSGGKGGSHGNRATQPRPFEQAEVRPRCADRHGVRVVEVTAPALQGSRHVLAEGSSFQHRAPF